MKNQTQDALAMLKADHQQVATLFADFEALSDRSKVSKKRLADQICAALRLHTRLEEEIFYPAVRGPVDDDDLMDEALVEHAAAKDLIAQIEELDPGDELYDARIKVLSEQIAHHVEEEEGQMFPEVKKSGVDLAALGQQMAELKNSLSSAD
ncbi:hemerythrin domain-containing protein [Pseudoduganella danionis]|uniref:Hemerythrin domain-containing protein n=1 Tax=Pseudoduganella danionis TaxID=1890295 RepID=A0ABW9SN77_9BURK|nr:hemerythrin domain-containing protein [Pseudoduganella danionis]MTW32668.1 hemerythrin domain-containing protein [Pseudoduganella danionis]